jgi:hypothetical protein
MEWMDGWVGSSITLTELLLCGGDSEGGFFFFKATVAINRLFGEIFS